MALIHLSDSQKNDLGKKIKRVIANLGKQGSWRRLADVGPRLSANGISYKDYHYSKLAEFMREFSDIFEFRSVPSSKEGAPANLEIRIKRIPQGRIELEEGMGLFDWAVIRDSQIEDLAENIAVPEKWYYGSVCPKDPRKRYFILTQYLKHTFGRLFDENKIGFCEGDGKPLVAFNTGLVDRKYEDIYALFEENVDPECPKEWCLNGFFSAGSKGGGKQLVRSFNPLPAKADYFKGKFEYVFFDPRSGGFSCVTDHILIDNCRRLPAKFFEKYYGPHKLTQINGLSFDEAQRLDEGDERSKEYFNTFQDILKKNDKIYRKIVRDLDDAVKMAEKRAEWNYKTAIPMYYPTNKKMSFLLPLCLLEEGIADAALVVERCDNGNYIGQTILPLALAYSNSRLITKPDRDWLNDECPFEELSGPSRPEDKIEHSSVKAQVFKSDPSILARIAAQKHVNSTFKEKLVQPPMKIQVFKPDPKILARIAKSQEQAAAKKEANELSEEARAVEEAKSRTRTGGIKVSLKKGKSAK